MYIRKLTYKKGELIEDEVFRLIINAMLIARYGLIAMKLTKEATANGS